MNTGIVRKDSLKPLLRLAITGDETVILKLMERFYQLDHYPFYPEVASTMISSFIADHHLGRIWIIEEENIPVGYVALTFSFSFEFQGKNAFIDELFIEDGYRDRGIGTAVISYLLNESEKLGIKALHLEVEKHNEAGLNLYSKFNFIKHNRHLMTRMI